MFGKRNIILISLICLLAVTFLSYLPSFKNGFTNFDDDLYVTENNLIKDISPANIKRIFSSFQLGLYKPLVMLSFAIEYHFFNLRPFPFHLTNIVLHLFNVFLVFWIFYLLSADISVAFITALLFGIHPMHVESVAWVTERKDVLFSFFFLWGALSYLYYLRKGSRFRYYLSLGAFLLSLLAKPTAITLPLVLLLFDFLQKRKGYKEALIDKIPFFALAIVFAVINIYAHYLDPNPRPPQVLGLIDGFFNAVYCIFFYLKKIFLPFKLSCVYAYPLKSVGFFSLQFYQSIAAVIFLACVILFTRKYSRKIIFGSLFFLITLLPALGIVPIFVGFAADRYTYIPYIGVFYIIAEGIRWLYKREVGLKAFFRVVLTVGLVFVIGALSTLTFNRTKVWKDSFALWDNVLKNYPDEPYAYYSRGLIFLKGNDLITALSEFEKAIKLRPGFVEPRINSAVIYSRQGDPDRAILEYSRIIEFSPQCFEAYNNRGNLLGRQGKYALAIADFSQAIKINPWHALSYYNRGITYLAENNYQKCLEDLYKAKSFGFQVDPVLFEDVSRRASQKF